MTLTLFALAPLFVIAVLGMALSGISERPVLGFWNWRERNGKRDDGAYLMPGHTSTGGDGAAAASGGGDGGGCSGDGGSC